MADSYTANLGLIQTEVNTSDNTWGDKYNTDLAITDSGIAGYLSLSVAGSDNVVLDLTQGTVSQSTNKIFNLTGALTGDISVLWPEGITGVFVIKNATTGAFSLSVGSDNGSAAAAGNVAAIPNGGVATVFCDGTNMTLAGLSGSGTWTPTDTSGAGLTFTSAVGFYRLSPGLVSVWGSLTYPSTSDTSNMAIGGLPFKSANLGISTGYLGSAFFAGGGGNPSGVTTPNYGTIVSKNSTSLGFSYSGGNTLTNAQLTTFTVTFSCTYPI